jgi:glycosyltransferase involved in cell wall biosynthesis
VADDWISRGLAQDPWLRWWNRPGSQLVRAGLELSGARTRLDRVAPTRPHAGCDRLPDLYGDTGTPPAPDSITDFRFERIFFSSLTLRVATQNAGFPVGHADVIPPGITSETFVSEVKPMGTPITRFLIACPLQSASGVMTALKALKATRDRGLRFKLGIYGRGESDYVPQLRSFVVQNQLPVEFLPVSDLNRDVVKIYRQHDAFLYTSEEEEPFATTILEAMASGLPVIGSWIGCVREFLRHGENAFIYAPGEDLELASRMEELHRQPALRHQMAETAQAETMAQFSFSTNVDRVEAYLEQTLEYWRQTGGTPVDPVPD